ncbi:hypothetical protein Y10_18790 [Neptunitalea sp. Y10]|uniref:Uncharacterized protein n=2 Tax=Neptunitalea lumnitzerae TaxID=2965509 RepID=A0ABQ5MJM4_9FLAO|nr:hypothetical protein Y10_18790 [Neptunitalea sp. Y10]
MLMKTKIPLETAIAYCNDFYAADSVDDKRAIGSSLISDLEVTYKDKANYVNSTLSPILQLHVDTFNRTKIKLKPENLKALVTDLYNKNNGDF